MPAPEFNNFIAPSNNFVPIMRQLSRSSTPGPRPIQTPSDFGQAEVSTSHARPVSVQCAPFVFGDESPKLVDANAATTFPCPINEPESNSFSSKIDAYPTLSLLSNLFRLFMDVAWTEYQFSTPIGRLSVPIKRICASVLSVSYLYLNDSIKKEDERNENEKKMC